MAKDLELKLRITADGKVAVEALDRVDKSLDGVGASGEDAGKRAASGLGQIKTAVATLGLVALAREFVQVNAAMESSALAMEAITGSQDGAAEAMSYVAAVADRLGQSIPELTQQFVSLSAATKGTALEGEATREVFEAVVGAMSRLGRSSAQTQQALVAVSQMAAKGTVSMEELRGQLGEALPGAIQAMADAMGVSVQQLGEMIESGQVLARDALPALARGLDEAFGADQVERVESLSASVNRFHNAVAQAFTAPGQNGLSDAFGVIIDLATQGLTGAANGLAALGKNLGALGAYATGAISSWEALTLAIEDNNRAGQANIDGLSATQAAAREYEALSERRAKLLAEEARLESELAAARIKAGVLPGGYRERALAARELADVQAVLAEVTARTSSYEQQLAAETAKTADAQTEAAAAVGVHTDQQRMLAEQMEGVTDAATTQAGALASQAKAIQESTEAVVSLIESQAAQELTAARVAQALGDEASAMTYAARSADTLATARRVEAEAIERSLAAMEADLAKRRAAGAISDEEAAKLSASITALTAKAQAARASAAASDAEALSARLALNTYGDQSAALGTLIAQRDRLTQSLAAYTAAQANAVNGALYLAQAQADLAAAEQQLADARARAGGAEQSGELQVYVDLVEQARARVSELTLATQGGAEADANAAQTKARLAEVNRLIADAARDAAANITLEVQASNRQLEITRARIDLASAEIARRRDLAAARGEAIAAATLEVDLMRQEVEAAKAAAESKREQAAALAEQARLMQVAAEAAGDYSAAQRAQVDAVADAAELLRIEAEQLDIVARTKREAAQAAAELADQQRILGEAFAQAGIVGVDSMEEVRAAIARLTDGGEIAALGDALEEAFRRGALGAEEYRAALELVQAKQDELKGGGRSVGVDYETLWRTSNVGGQVPDNVLAGTGLPSDVRKRIIDEYREWEREFLLKRAEQTKELAAREAAVGLNKGVSTGQTVNVNIEGILDVNDRATLDSLARKLKPVLGSLERQGVR